MDIVKLSHQESSRYHYNRQIKREPPKPKQVARSLSETVRFHNDFPQSETLEAEQKASRTFRRTTIDGLPDPTPTRDVLEACHFHLAAKARRKVQPPENPTPSRNVMEACRFHIEPFSTGRSCVSQPLTPRSTCETKDAPIESQEFRSCNAPTPLHGAGADVCSEVEPTEPSVQTPKKVLFHSVSVPPEHGSQLQRKNLCGPCLAAGAFNEHRSGRARSLTPEYHQRYAGNVIGTSLPGADPVRSADVSRSVARSDAATCVLHPCSPESKAACCDAAPPRSRKILHLARTIPSLGLASPPARAPQPPQSYTQRRAAVQRMHRLSLPVTLSGSELEARHQCCSGQPGLGAGASMSPMAKLRKHPSTPRSASEDMATEKAMQRSPRSNASKCASSRFSLKSLEGGQ